MGLSAKDKLLSMSLDSRKEYISTLSVEQRKLLSEALQANDWRVIARPEQLAPSGQWQNWLIMAGRGFGKTRCLSEWIIKRSKKYTRTNIIGATADDARDILIEGESGILACCKKDYTPRYIKNERKLKWPNGAISSVFTADEPERLRGKQHTGLIMDEIAAWRYPEAYTQAMLGLRLGDNPQCVIATTPKPVKILQDIIDNPATVLTRGTTYDNKKNLAQQYINTIIAVYEGTRIGKQELSGEMLTDTMGALWNSEMIFNAREKIECVFDRIVISVDPAVTSGEDSDETGIVVCGTYTNDKGEQHGAVIGDYSGKYTPNEWSEKIAYLFESYDADKVIGEVNNGGDLVETVLRQSAPNIPFKAIRATKGKYTRAEPVAALYEQNKIAHLREFEELETQMKTYVPGISKKSPDRLDAMVYGFTELMLKNFNVLIG